MNRLGRIVQQCANPLFRKRLPHGKFKLVRFEDAELELFTTEHEDRICLELELRDLELQMMKDAFWKDPSPAKLDELLGFKEDTVSMYGVFGAAFAFDEELFVCNQLTEGRDKGLAFRNEGRNGAKLSILRTVENLKYRNPDWNYPKAIREALEIFKTEYSSKDRQRWWPDVKAEDGTILKKRGVPSMGTVKNHWLQEYKARRWPPPGWTS